MIIIFFQVDKFTYILNYDLSLKYNHIQNLTKSEVTDNYNHKVLRFKSKSSNSLSTGITFAKFDKILIILLNINVKDYSTFDRLILNYDNNKNIKIFLSNLYLENFFKDNKKRSYEEIVYKIRNTDPELIIPTALIDNMEETYADMLNSIQYVIENTNLNPIRHSRYLFAHSNKKIDDNMKGYSVKSVDGTIYQYRFTKNEIELLNKFLNNNE